ncbi:SDR family oxidoreductase [Neptunicella marina]|uniref:SDR family oxidoreductase n=1 Tax=Neptunicella marina TaxID=2125989 RepID=A0A8J6IX89_9ALTE|nr:SDR family oxidoreductase [Neptunicella marina]MBC3767126.1 SDR family oxidoreductase [Neptunicella marina]
MKTVLITGCSSGYGLETARYLQAQGYNVIATMRKPDLSLFSDSNNVRVLALDVTSDASIHAAIEECGPIDILINNAGIGLLGAFEATPVNTIREVFDTNTFGVMAMCQAVIPQFRERRAGTIINVTSSVVLKAHPLVAVYTASKTAVDGFSRSLAHELEQFNIRVKQVEPGYGPTTAFAANGQQRMQNLLPEPYIEYASKLFAEFARATDYTLETDVAETILKAINEQSDVTHFPAGADAIALVTQ